MSSACATTSTLTLPSCTRRLEVEGQHARAGRTLTLDHRFDLPGTRTRLVLQSPEGTTIVERWNDTPDLLHLGVGCGVGALGCGLGAVGLLGAGPLAVVSGGALVAGGAAVALTGWHPSPADDVDLEAWCQAEPAGR